MDTNLLDDVGSLMSPNTFGRVAGALGTSTSTTGEVARTGIATLLGGLSNAGSTEDGATRLLNLIHNKHYDEAPAVDRLGSSDTRTLAEEGKDMLPAIFGNKLDTVVSGVGATAHLQGPAAGWLLSLLTPYVLGAVGKRVREDHLDEKGLSSLLGAQRSRIEGLMPNQLTGILGVSGMPAYAPPQPARRPAVVAPVAVRRVEPVKRNLNWLWALLPLVAIAILAFYVVNTTSPDVKPLPAQTTPPVEVARPPAVPALPIPAPAPMEPSAGIEGFANALNATDTILPATFLVEDLSFAAGSSDVPSDQASILRIAEAMQTHPSATVRVVAYGDPEGETAVNEQLAKDRADSVRAALIDNGIAGDRIEALGQTETAKGPEEMRPTEIVLMQR